MDKYQETFTTWNKIASTYQAKFMDLDLYNATYDVICQTVTKDKAKILDIGCGPGNITKYLLSKRADYEIFGIDIAPIMVELARNHNPKATFAVMDSRNLHEIKTKFDGIICGFCLPYLSQTDTKKLIADSYNLLNDQGLLYLSFVEGDPKRSAYQSGSGGERVYFHFHLLDEIKAKLHDNDFTTIDVFTVEYKKSALDSQIHTIVIARK